MLTVRPLPDSAALALAPGLALAVRVAARGPIAAGVKVTTLVQVALGPSVVVPLTQVPPESAKSLACAPASASVTAPELASPLLRTVKVWVALAPRTTPAKSYGPGVTLSTASVPKPLRLAAALALPSPAVTLPGALPRATG